MFWRQIPYPRTRQGRVRLRGWRREEGWPEEGRYPLYINRNVGLPHLLRLHCSWPCYTSSQQGESVKDHLCPPNCHRMQLVLNKTDFSVFINFKFHMKPHKKPLAHSCSVFFADTVSIFSSANYNNCLLLFYCSGCLRDSGAQCFQAENTPLPLIYIYNNKQELVEL